MRRVYISALLTLFSFWVAAQDSKTVEILVDSTGNVSSKVRFEKINFWNDSIKVITNPDSVHFKIMPGTLRSWKGNKRINDKVFIEVEDDATILLPVGLGLELINSLSIVKAVTADPKDNITQLIGQNFYGSNPFRMLKPDQVIKWADASNDLEQLSKIDVVNKETLIILDNPHDLELIVSTDSDEEYLLSDGDDPVFTRLSDKEYLLLPLRIFGEIQTAILREKGASGKEIYLFGKPESEQGTTHPSITSNGTTLDYHKFIKDSLDDRFSKYNESKTKKDGLTITNIYLNKDLRPFDGTVIPECNKKNSYYQIHVLFNSDDELNSVFFETTENNQVSDFGISAGGQLGINDPRSETESAGKTPSIKVISSELFGPFELGLDVKATAYDNKSNYLTKHGFSINTCESPIHVSIIGGFYYSSLNDPINVVDGSKPDGTRTLYGDNTNGQRAITVMALFHPKPRDRSYSHKSLSFMEKWGVAFGTKLEQQLFTDLLLGLNYEFAKGGSFTSGIHYGQHQVIRGYDKFDFGNDWYNGPSPFTNDQLDEQWDFGWFIGVTIDFRVIGNLRIIGNREYNLNNNGDG